MHFAFIPYGASNNVDFFLKELNYKFMPLKLSKKGEKDKFILIQTQLRTLPFGIHELVFPKEYLEEVLSALIKKKEEPVEFYDFFDKKVLGVSPMKTLRKSLKLKEVPDFKKSPHPNFIVSEYRKRISIIPVGIREDRDMVEKEGELKGWSHEAI